MKLPVNHLVWQTTPGFHLLYFLYRLFYEVMQCYIKSCTMLIFFLYRFFYEVLRCYIKSCATVIFFFFFCTCNYTSMIILLILLLMFLLIHITNNKCFVCTNKKCFVCTYNKLYLLIFCTKYSASYTFVPFLLPIFFA